jgi:hypothetical protein
MRGIDKGASPPCSFGEDELLGHIANFVGRKALA